MLSKVWEKILFSLVLLFLGRQISYVIFPFLHFLKSVEPVHILRTIMVALCEEMTAYSPTIG